jgi:chaperonin GroEL (HSP60 family)
MAKSKLSEMNQHFLTLSSEREKKAYTKQVEKELRANFEEDLKKLTITQGRMLIKLIDRETGSTSYELVKELRGNLSAIFWQALARVFGSNLKTEYDKDGTDKLTEEILVAIDQGYL